MYIYKRVVTTRFTSRAHHFLFRAHLFLHMSRFRLSLLLFSGTFLTYFFFMHFSTEAQIAPLSSSFAQRRPVYARLCKHTHIRAYAIARACVCVYSRHERTKYTRGTIAHLLFLICCPAMSQCRFEILAIPSADASQFVIAGALLTILWDFILPNGAFLTYLPRDFHRVFLPVFVVLPSLSSRQNAERRVKRASSSVC